ncbi:ABC transporter substrate-binding protein [Jonquetella anthropi]|uniref:ABC transporter substrate-binding protein n=1 Tax=Jonquetella anthropi TaxID=428712 RepID=UPI000586C0ED|nr:ABC transporter substrate-binding protein [Jonquetella anthropi]
MRVKKVMVALALAAALAASGNAAEMKHFRLGVLSEAFTLDPTQATDTYSFGAARQIFEPLVNVDGHTKKIYPVLAEKWEMPDDHTYKFYLRHGVKFHNGDEMKASDVVFSLKRFATESVFASSVGKFIDPEGFEAPDDYTVIVRTKGPVGGFLENMKLPAMAIMSERAVKEGGKEYFRHPVGTGPFKFVSWTKGERIEMEAFKDYWGQKPAFEKFSIITLPDASTRVIALETGKVDMIYQIPNNEVDRLNETGKAKVVQAPGLSLTYLGMNNDSPKLSDPRVRQAIDLAINKDAYQQVVFQGMAVTPAGPLIPASTFTPKNSAPAPFDQQKAKELLAEAGVKNLTLSLWTTNSEARVNGATVIQSMLAQVGIRVEIQVFEGGVFYDRIKRNDHELFLASWGMQTNRDAGKFWNGLFNSKAIGSSNNCRFSDKEIDEMIDASYATLDQEKRFEIFQKIWERLLELKPMIALSVSDELYAGRKDLVGMEDLCDGQINYLGNLTLK